MNAKVGDLVVTLNIKGEPAYIGKMGRVTHIDALGQIHGDWGGCALISGEDEFYVIGGDEE